MDKALTISVAMCTCNGEVYLREQLDSILAQTLPPNELIVCDDVSADGTLAILDEFKQRSPFPVTIIANQNRVGVCKNFQNAIERCSGDIIFLADQDDVWLPCKFATVMAAFDSSPRCGYVFSNAELIDEQGRGIGSDLWTSISFDKKEQYRYSAGDQLNVMLKKWFTLPYGMTMAFRAVFKSKLTPFERSSATAHDTWISLALTSMGAYGVALPSLLVKYRQHPKQLASAGKRLGFVDLVANKRSTRAEEYKAFADFLICVAARLEQLDPHNEHFLRSKTQLIEKATHVRARVRVNSSHGFQRLRIVFQETISGRYSRYSRSIKSIVKDIVSS